MASLRRTTQPLSWSEELAFKLSLKRGIDPSRSRLPISIPPSSARQRLGSTGMPGRLLSMVRTVPMPRMGSRNRAVVNPYSRSAGPLVAHCDGYRPHVDSDLLHEGFKPRRIHRLELRRHCRSAGP